MVLSGFVGVALVARMLYASRSHVACNMLCRSTMSRAVCQLVIFEQNMPGSSESTGRLVDRKHTLGPRNEILSLGGVVVGDASLGGRPWEG